MINLLDILSLDTIKVPLEGEGKRAVIDELVDVLAQAGRVRQPASLKEAVWSRETTRTTGIGHALAIPHGKCEGIDNLAMAIGKPAEPIDFQAIDNKPVRLVVLLASPIDRTSDHIQALAKISRMMTIADFRERIYNAESAEEVFDLIQHQEAAPVGGN